MKRIFILLWIVAVFSTLAVVGNLWTADKTKYNNDFVRVFPPHFTEGISNLNIENRKYSIAGFSDEKVYLHDRSNQGRLLVSGRNLQDTTCIYDKIPRDFAVTIDSPNFFLHNGYLPEIRTSNMTDCVIDTTITKIPGFTLIQPLTSTKFVLRTVDLQKMKSLLVRSDQPNSPKDIFTTQVDGILCTDGFLQYSEELQQLLYVYRYRNEVLCLDTTLNVRWISKTIDTTSVAKISVAAVNGEIKMSSPPLVVNKGICVSGKYLFVHSNLIAKNEDINRSKSNSVIDIYALSDGHYISSFYIENLNGKKMLSFKVSKHSLVALFPGYVVWYDLNQEHLKR